MLRVVADEESSMSSSLESTRSHLLRSLRRRAPGRVAEDRLPQSCASRPLDRFGLPSCARLHPGQARRSCWACSLSERASSTRCPGLGLQRFRRPVTGEASRLPGRTEGPCGVSAGRLMMATLPPRHSCLAGEPCG
jgi:hypothetical protein